MNYADLLSIAELLLLVVAELVEKLLTRVSLLLILSAILGRLSLNLLILNWQLENMLRLLIWFWTLTWNNFVCIH